MGRTCAVTAIGVMAALVVGCASSGGDSAGSASASTTALVATTIRLGVPRTAEELTSAFSAGLFDCEGTYLAEDDLTEPARSLAECEGDPDGGFEVVVYPSEAEREGDTDPSYQSPDCVSSSVDDASQEVRSEGDSVYHFTAVQDNWYVTAHGPKVAAVASATGAQVILCPPG